MMDSERSDPAKRDGIERSYRERRAGFLAWARRRLPDLAAAEDALQDAFVAALDRSVGGSGGLTLVEDAAAYVFAALRNRVSDQWRRKEARRRAGSVEIPAEVFAEIAAQAGYDPADTLVRDELLAALEVAIVALPPEQREVIEAQALGGLTFRELAERTGESIDTLIARKRYAIRKLAAALEYWMDFED